MPTSLSLAPHWMFQTISEELRRTVDHDHGGDTPFSDTSRVCDRCKKTQEKPQGGGWCLVCFGRIRSTNSVFFSFFGFVFFHKWLAFEMYLRSKSTKDTGWWFGCHFLFSHILGMSSSQLTFIFFRGVAQPPTRIVLLGNLALRGNAFPVIQVDIYIYIYI